MWNRGPPPAPPDGQPVLDSWRIEDVGLGQVRRRMKACAHEWMNEVRARDFVVAVSEIVTNALEHGGGRGRVRLWVADGEVICEVADEGDGVADLQAGLRPPAVSAEGGYGLWMARSLCRRVHGTTTKGAGTIVWLHGEARRAQRR
jgi:serine/threonine-protein kinase RsbW